MPDSASDPTSTQAAFVSASPAPEPAPAPEPEPEPEPAPEPEPEPEPSSPIPEASATPSPPASPPASKRIPAPDDIRFMRRALDLALRGRGRVEPNPVVGALVVRNDRVVGEGWHGQFGGPHAEVHALRQAGEASRGATLYVTLEPCSHHGKTGPCVEAVVAAGVSRVVYALRDPSGEAGGGHALLEARGVMCDGGVLDRQARGQNLPFVKRALRGLPAVRLKWAMTLDGKIATRTRKSRWITGEDARRHAHRGRARADAVLVGIETVLVDDPTLTARLEGATVRGATGRPPVRVVLDSKARLPLDSRLVATLEQAPLVLAVSEEAPADRVAALEAAGVEVLRIARSERDGVSGVDLEAVLRALAARGADALPAEAPSDPLAPWPVSRVVVEGGARVHAAFLAGRLADELTVYVAPIVLGGVAAPSPVAGEGIETLREAISIASMRVRRLGADFVLEGRVASPDEVRRRVESAVPASAPPRGGGSWPGRSPRNRSSSRPSASPVAARSASEPREANGDAAFEDQELRCGECGGTFTHTAGAQAFYRDKGFQSPPKRCPACRKSRRQGGRPVSGERARGPRPVGPGRRRPRGPVKLYDVKCGTCGADAQVPFEPDPSRPVYCRDCYAAVRAERPRRGRPPRGPEPGGAGEGAG